MKDKEDSQDETDSVNASLDAPEWHFFDADDDLVDYLEKHGEQSIKDIQQSTFINKENGQKLFNLLIAGIGSSLFLLTQRQHMDFISDGLALFVVFWSLCAIYTLLRVLSPRERGSVSSTPYGIYHEGCKRFDYEFISKEKGFTGTRNKLSIIRRANLENLTKLANEGLRENMRVSSELKRVRIAAIITPICVLAVSGLVYFFL